MQDLDSAVGRLDNILMTVYVFVVLIVLAVALVCVLTCSRWSCEEWVSRIPGHTTGNIGHWCRSFGSR